MINIHRIRNVVTTGLVLLGSAYDARAQKEPEILAGVKLEQFFQVPLRLICHVKKVDGRKVLFSGRVTEDGSVVISQRVGNAPVAASSRQMELGDVFPGSSLELVCFTPKEGVDSYGTPTETSELIVKDQKTEKTHRVVLGTISATTDTYALLKTPNGLLKVELDKRFSLSPQPATIWRVMKISPMEVLVRNEETGDLARIVIESR